MTDESLMPWGIHEGKQMVDVPADYLLFLYENSKVHGEVKRYIHENLETIKMEVAIIEKRRKK